MERHSNDILLSICIPTHNRSAYLKNTLLSIVNQDSFDDRCEIVISDNDSNDDTKEMVTSEFLCKYGNIRYFCNERNIYDENYVTAMNLARGKYVKLHSDIFCFAENKLIDLLYYLNKYDYNVFFLLNGNRHKTIDTITQCDNFDRFVQIVSFYSTWITGIIFKNSIYKTIDDKSRYANCCLSQTDILFRVLTLSNSHSLVINEKMMNSQPIESKGGYNVCEVFIKNYLRLYQEYLQKGMLRKKIYKYEKVNLLQRFIFPLISRKFILRDKSLQFDFSKGYSTILKYYWYELPLYLYPMYLVKGVFNKLLRVLRSDTR